MKNLLLALIALYQKTISPDHSRWGQMRHPHGFCKYYPSCSEYMRLCVVRRGAFAGFSRGVWRLLRCNPFSKGGVDPV